jgi:nucleoside-diphosphate-sugar epimerase
MATPSHDNNFHPLKVMVLGANGFIGSHLVQRLLDEGHEVIGVDLMKGRIEKLLGRSNFKFLKKDFRVARVEIEELLADVDVLFPLIAVATPKTYVTDPIGVFKLDFEDNLPYVRFCVDHDIRIIFPSTSEVYGLTDDVVFEEASTGFTYGPISSERWIYASCKQLMDRLIFAYGRRNGLRYTIFRPFNWLGPGLDTISEEEGTNRLVTQLISDIVFRRKIHLVDGGIQRRTFTDIRDGIDALVKILVSEPLVNGKIYNIGNPDNEFSVKSFSDTLLASLSARSGLNTDGISVEVIPGHTYYGEGYQDVNKRVPSIKSIAKDLGWIPRYSLQETLDYISDNIDIDGGRVTWKRL